MKIIRNRISFNIHIWLIILLLTITSAEAGIKDKICFAYRSGKEIVLIINAKLSTEDEQYADWSYYLNDFSTHNGKNYSFFKIDLVALGVIVDNALQFNNDYSTLFIKKGKDSLFYKGPIVEPQVYKYVHLKYSEKQIPGYLKQFAPDVVNVKLKCGN